MLAPGHRALFKKSDVTDTRRYFEDPRDAVSAGMAAGKSLAELEQTIELERYSGWANDDRLRVRNIDAAYRNLQLCR